jgi:hypothetical protein
MGRILYNESRMIERPEGIIITFPVQFLIDLGVTVLHRRYELAYKAKREYRLRNYKLKLWKGEGQQPVILNTKKNLIKLGYEECLRQLKMTAEDEELLWWHSIGNKPKIDVLYAYITMLNKIRFKATIVSWEPGGEMTFDDNRKRTAKHWLLLDNPVRIPDIPFKGFQGFRYTQKLF